jgi:cytoskeletal protein CcmA (bactofilin family)
MPTWWQRSTAKSSTKKTKKPAKQRAQQRGQVSEPFTFIHQGTVIVGNVQVPGRARIHGEVHGNVNVLGLLEIAASAVVDGHYICAENIKILGQVRADVWAKGSVEIWRGASLTGDLYAAQLDIEQGATFIGSSDMRPAGYEDMPKAFHAYLGAPEEASDEPENWDDVWLEPATPAEIAVAKPEDDTPTNRSVNASVNASVDASVNASARADTTEDA